MLSGRRDTKYDPCIRTNTVTDRAVHESLASATGSVKKERVPVSGGCGLVNLLKGAVLFCI
jgi:hypothetical protein